MNLRDLEYLVAVHDLKNFSQAAERCFVSQPTLSGQIKKLEDELGVSLIERSTRRVLFTEAGETVVRHAMQILTLSACIKSTARDFDDPLAGEFHLGLIPTIGPFLLPLVMSALNRELPQMQLFLHELQTEVLIDRLLSGKLDAAILAKLDWDYPVTERFLYNEPLWLAMSEADPLAMVSKPLPESILEGKSLLMLEDGHCLRDQAMGVCFAAGANEDNRYQATSMDTLLHMVASGHGMTLVPELAIRKSVTGVVFKPFVKNGPARDVILIGRKNATRELALERLARFIVDFISVNRP